MTTSECNHPNSYFASTVGWYNCIDCPAINITHREPPDMTAQVVHNEEERYEAKVEQLTGKVNSITYAIPTGATDELRYILDDLFTEWRLQFTQANKEYGSGPHLGSKGVIPDLHRKTRKLVKSIWEGQELKREQPREVAMDMIGHLFLMVYLLDQESGAA